MDDTASQEMNQEREETTPRHVDAIRPWKVIRRAWAIYRQNFKLLVGMAVIGVLLWALQQVLFASGVEPLWWLGFALFVPAIAVLFWSTAAMVVAASNAYLGASGERPE